MNECATDFDELKLKLSGLALSRWKEHKYSDDTSMVLWCAPSSIGEISQIRREQVIILDHANEFHRDVWVRDEYRSLQERLHNLMWTNGGIADPCMTDYTKIIPIMNHKWVRHESTCGSIVVVVS